jgi:hypothetical protein
MKKKKPPLHGKRQKAFDLVMDAFRSVKNVQVGVSAVNIGSGGKGTANPCQPSLVDFRADVTLVFRKIFKSESAWRDFQAAYLDFDSEDYIEREMHAQKIYGKGMQNLKEGVGAEFIKRGIFPMHGNGSYFRTIRRTK